MMARARPTILCFSGFDPTGGAGIQADIEAIAAAGCHALPLITAMTDQDSGHFYSLHPTDCELLAAQINHLFNDFQPAAIKVGLVASWDVLKQISHVVQTHPDIPLVVDPVLSAGGDGTTLIADNLAQAIRQQLLPFATLATPNTPELEALATAVDDVVDHDSGSEAANAAELLTSGCQAVLVTGTHAAGEAVINRLYSAEGTVLESSWPRLPGSYHGSGCTLASHITAQLAKGVPLQQSVEIGQHYTWQTLERADKPGRSQFLPRRLGREAVSATPPLE